MRADFARTELTVGVTILGNKADSGNGLIGQHQHAVQQLDTNGLQGITKQLKEVFQQ